MTIGATVVFSASLGQHFTTLQSYHWKVDIAYAYISMSRWQHSSECSLSWHLFSFLSCRTCKCEGVAGVPFLGQAVRTAMLLTWAHLFSFKIIFDKRPTAESSLIIQEHCVLAVERCSLSPHGPLSRCSAHTSFHSTCATSAHTSREMGMGNTETSWLSLEPVQDSSPAEPNERLLLTLGQVLTKCFVRYNPGSISTYIKWKLFTVTKPIVFYLSNVYPRWYHQKASSFSPLWKYFQSILFLGERVKKMLFEIQGVSFSSL